MRLYRIKDLSWEMKKQIYHDFYNLLTEVEYTRVINQDFGNLIYGRRPKWDKVFGHYGYYYVRGKNGGVVSLGIVHAEEGKTIMVLQYMVARNPRNGFGTKLIRHLRKYYGPTYDIYVNPTDASLKFYLNQGCKVVGKVEFAKNVGMELPFEVFTKKDSYILKL